MEREILFRGKRLEIGQFCTESCNEWVYGGYAKDFSGSTHIYCPMYSHRMVVVDPATVGQYTGLTDKNGVKIFRGDIVKLNAALYLVDWISPVGMFALRYVSNRKSITDFSIIGPERCEVCGNIHDNPELLEGNE